MTLSPCAFPFPAGSLVLMEARERHIAGGKYSDVPMDSLYIVRGENLTLLGELVS